MYTLSTMRITKVHAIIGCAIVALLAGVILYVSIPNTTTRDSETKQGQRTTSKLAEATPESLLERVNQERAAVGVASLVIDEGVQKSAQLKADDMINRNYRTHFLSEDPNATLTQEMASYVEPVCVSSSENYTYNDSTDNSTIYAAFDSKGGWLNSPLTKPQS